MSKIKIIKVIAKNELGTHIQKLQELKKHINSYEKPENIVESFSDLCARVVASLQRFFDDDLLASEFTGLPIGPIDDDHSWSDNRRTLLDAVEQRILWLENLQASIDKMPQSENTPTVNRYRS